MSIDIANPGGSSDDLKAALRDLVGQKYLSEGSVSSPVLYVDIPIPATGNEFELKLRGFLFDTTDYLMAAVSFDNGSTWLYDTDTFAAYTDVNVSAFGKALTLDRGINNPIAAGGDTLLSIISDNISDGSTIDGAIPIGASGSVIINPGGVGHCAWIKSEMIYDLPSDSYYLALDKSVARVLTQTGRITNIALLPYGSGDMPPSGEEQITAGSYTLTEVK